MLYCDDRPGRGPTKETAMNLNTYVALIALDADRRSAFLNDPQAAVVAAHLNVSGPALQVLERLAKILDSQDYPGGNPIDDPYGGGGGGG